MKVNTTIAATNRVNSINWSSALNFIQDHHNTNGPSRKKMPWNREITTMITRYGRRTLFWDTLSTKANPLYSIASKLCEKGVEKNEKRNAFVCVCTRAWCQIKYLINILIEIPKRTMPSICTFNNWWLWTVEQKEKSLTRNKLLAASGSQGMSMSISDADYVELDCTYLPLSDISIVNRDSFNLIIKLFLSACMHIAHTQCMQFAYNAVNNIWLNCFFISFHLMHVAGKFSLCVRQWQKLNERWMKTSILTKIPSTNPFWIVGTKSRIW